MGTESRPPSGGVATGSQAAPEVTPTPAVQRRHGPAGGRARGDYPGAWFRVFAGLGAYVLAFHSSIVFGICSAGGFLDFYPGSPSPGQPGVFPPPKSPFPPVDRSGRAGYGTRNQSQRRGRAGQRLGRLPVPAAPSRR